MRPTNHPEFTYRPWPELRRKEQQERARAAVAKRMEERRVLLIAWLRERQIEDEAELKGMTGTGVSLYAITRRIELEARLEAWKQALAHAHSLRSVSPATTEQES